MFIFKLFLFLKTCIKLLKINYFMLLFLKPYNTIFIVKLLNKIN